MAPGNDEPEFRQKIFLTHPKRGGPLGDRPASPGINAFLLQKPPETVAGTLQCSLQIHE